MSAIVRFNAFMSLHAPELIQTRKEALAKYWRKDSDQRRVAPSSYWQLQHQKLQLEHAKEMEHAKYYCACKDEKCEKRREEKRLGQKKWI